METKKKVRQAKAPTPKDSKDYINEKCVIFGNNMRVARKERGFTSEALGKFLKISTAYVGLIERGERCPSLETFMKICDFFGESYEEMLTPRYALKIAESKAASKVEASRDKVKRKQKMVAGMLNTFDVDELDHIIGMIKSFKTFSQIKQPELNEEEEADE
ncbi:MAG: helix-turn-helix domain-containing protein [Defluviitaleaceae bacterium]|nr:helix-turn-helix domain-containing protein [Defluviitaleaceae bacterium]